MRILAITVAAAAVTATASGCVPNSTSASATSTAPIATSAMAVAPAVPVATTIAAPATLTIPDVTGKNGAIASDELKKLGFTHVSYASGTPGVRMVILPSNWTVKSIEPAAGTSAAPDDTIVLTLVKING